ncbi:MAG: hypothetical protein QW275_02120, partial [Candidatus Anstonellaceae archaeon]
MPALEFNALYHSVLVFLLAVVPGLSIGLPLLRNSSFSKAEKFLLSFFLGLIAVPSLLFLQGLIGIKFSLFLVFANF